MKLFSFLCVVVGLPTLVMAQPSSPVPYPGGEAVALRAPERAKWVVTYNPSKAPDGAEPSAEDGGKKAQEFTQKLIFVKDGAIVFERILRPNAPARDKWSSQGFTFSIAPGQKKHTAVENGELGMNYYTDFAKTDFPGFEAISPKDYVDVKKVLGRDCLVYRLQGEGKGDLVAYVDFRSRLPVLSVAKGEVRVYQFETPPSTSLTLPPDAQEFLKARAKLKADVARAAATHGR